jgi:hypothetical protein
VVFATPPGAVRNSRGVSPDATIESSSMMSRSEWPGVRPWAESASTAKAMKDWRHCLRHCSCFRASSWRRGSTLMGFSRPLHMGA